MPELMSYANVTDLNVAPFPALPGGSTAHFFSYIPDDPMLVLGERVSAGSLAGLWLDVGPPSQFITSTNAYLPEYDGLAIWVNEGVGAGPGGTDVIVDYSVLDISAAPAAGTPVSNIWTIHFHAAMDQPPSPYATPPPLVTLTPHVDPLGINNYIDVSAEERFSPDSRLPIMWYRWFTGGFLNPDGSVTPSSAEITDYADVPLGPRRREFTYGPVPNGTYQFACAAFEPVFGTYYAAMSGFASVTIMGHLGHWTVNLPATGKVAAGRSLTGLRRLD